MRKIINILLVVIVLITMWYTTPIKIDKTFTEGFILSYENERVDHKGEIHIIGELSRNILSDNTFKGEVIVEEFLMKIQSPSTHNIKSRFIGLKSKFSKEPLMVSGMEFQGSHVQITGVIYISRDFSKVWGYSNEMRKYYEDNSVVFMAPADPEGR